MLITINFHKALQQKTNVKQHQFEVEDIVTLCRGFAIIFPELSKYFTKLVQNDVSETLFLVKKDKSYLQEKDYIKNKLTDDMSELWLVPSVAGGGKAGQILAGVALIAAGFFIGPQVSLLGNFVTGKTIIGIGINLVLGGIIAALTPTPKLPSTQTSDAPERVNNDQFGSFTNPTNTSGNVPLNYGYPRIGGQLISGKVKTVQHAKDEIIKASDFTT